MHIASLILWIVTALGGFYLLATWLAKGGMRETRLPTTVLFSHFGLAAVGLVLWIIYVLTDNHTIAWIAFALLVVVAVLGFIMVTRWLRDRRTKEAAAAQAIPAEQHFPLAAVVGHGALGAVTLVLVVLTAAEVTGG